MCWALCWCDCRNTSRIGCESKMNNLSYPYNLLFDLLDDASQLAYSARAEDIKRALGVLTNLERLVISSKYQFKMSREQISKGSDITLEKVALLESTAMQKLKRLRNLGKMYNMNATAFKLMRNKELERKGLLASDSNLSTILVEELGLPTRAYNSIKREGIDNLDELAKITVEELMMIRGIGVNTVNLIIEKLLKFGIVLQEN